VVLITWTYYLMTSLTATKEHQQHRKPDVLHLHSWNKSEGTGVPAVVKKKTENYVRCIDTARNSEIKANICNCKWYYKMQPGKN